jgi:hypothetical protein
METPTFEQILLLIVFILLPLFNFVRQRIQGRLKQKTSEKEPVAQIRRQAQATPAPPPTPRASHSRVHGPQAPIISTPISVSHVTKRSLLGTIRDVRRGMILMAILGPCRAFDPPRLDRAR